MTTFTSPRVTACALLSLLLACDRGGTALPTETAPPEAPTNRVAAPASVRRNLGMTFAKVERRAVARTLRLPGRFEELPTARREYRLPAAGFVELAVEQFQRVEAGAVLYRFDSPRWRDLQEQLNAAQADARLAEAAFDSIAPLFTAHERHHEAIHDSIVVWETRVEQLETLKQVGGVNAEDLASARAALAAARSDFAETLEKEAELTARRAEFEAKLTAATTRFDLLLGAASSLCGLTRAVIADESGDRAKWRILDRIEVTASVGGVVDAIAVTNGAWVEEAGIVASTVDPTAVRFRARALQSDSARLADGASVSIVPPEGGSLADATALRGALRTHPLADPRLRTLDVIVTLERAEAWARPGVSAYVEVTLPGSAPESLAIPLACVVRDGLDPIIFRRDPSNPDQLIRMEADLGGDDGRWVEIKSGVRENDELVMDGVYPLLIATSGTLKKGGHFHPDGSYHEGDD